VRLSKPPLRGRDGRGLSEVQVQQEREEKFDVKKGWELPDFGGLVPEGGRVDRKRDT
jgi:hypothetical protein